MYRQNVPELAIMGRKGWGLTLLTTCLSASLIRSMSAVSLSHAKKCPQSEPSKQSNTIMPMKYTDMKNKMLRNILNMKCWNWIKAKHYKIIIE